MKSLLLSLLAATLLLMPSPGFGLGMEKFGSALEIGHPSAEQPGWPAGMIRVVDHNSRIYSTWVNGGENFYFKANNREVLELVHFFSEMRLRDHVVTIKLGPLRTKSFYGEGIVCNVTLEHLGGIVGAMRRRSDSAETFEPKLVIYVDPKADSAWWKAASIPKHVKIQCEVDGWPVLETEGLPQRRLRYAQVMFEDGSPAADFRNELFTEVTLWDHAERPGFALGRVAHDGKFHVAFSDAEWQKLQAGEMWLTLSVGGHSVKARPDDPKLDASCLDPDPMAVKAFTIARPQ